MYDIKSLEFNLYKKTIKGHISSVFAMEELDILHPYEEISIIVKKQQLLKEAIETEDAESIGLFNDKDFYDLYIKLNDILYFCCPADYIIFKDFFKNVYKLKKDLFKKSNLLKEYLSRVSTFSVITDDIVKKIDDDGQVRDSASSCLFNLKREIKKIRKEIYHKLNRVVSNNNADKFIQDRIFTAKTKIIQ